MKKRKKIFLIFLIITLILILLLIVMLIFNPMYNPFDPLRRSERKIKEEVLELTPIGSSMEEVIRVIENNERWNVSYINHDLGFARPGPPDPEDVAQGSNVTIVGEKSIEVILGTYSGFTTFKTYVSTYWGFDENENLIDIYVYKISH